MDDRGAGTAQLVIPKGNCCGCTACYSACPVQAIAMQMDNEGFLYPQIDKNKCISCGKCVKVCPAKCDRNVSLPLRIFAAKSNDEVRARSSSGGGFTQIARWVESVDGAIYGVGFSDCFSATHMRSEKECEWQAFCTSKYMQSTLGDTFSDVRNDLIAGKWVLFTGTPCQVDGLKHYLDKTNTEKLITCDIVCHGVPSPKVWKDYLSYVERNAFRKIGSVNFRDKSEKGWHNSTLTIKDGNGRVLLSEEQSENCYFLMFFNHLILRPSCYECRYSNFNRPGDISLGDYWGVEKQFPDYDDDKGISLLMCNTQQGISVWEKIQSEMKNIEISPQKCIQPNLCAPANRPNRRELFWEIYTNKGFTHTAKEFGLLPLSLLDRVIRKMRRKLSKLKSTLLNMCRKLGNRE